MTAEFLVIIDRHTLYWRLESFQILVYLHCWHNVDAGYQHQCDIVLLVMLDLPFVGALCHFASECAFVSIYSQMSR